MVKVDSYAIQRLALCIAESTGRITTISDLRERARITDQRTVDKYLDLLLDNMLFFRVDVVDISNGWRRGIKAKYYGIDIRSGKRIFKRGYIKLDQQHVIENIVYLELRRRGYKVSAGRFRSTDIGFVLEKDGRMEFLRLITSPDEDREEVKRAFNAMRGAKTVLTIDRGINGVRGDTVFKNVISFLLE